MRNAMNEVEVRNHSFCYGCYPKEGLASFFVEVVLQVSAQN